MSRIRLSRRAAVAAIAGVAIVALFGVAVLTPFVGRILLAPALSAVEGRYGLVAELGELDLQLAQLRIGITNLQLAVRGHEAEPFLTVEEVRADLPWAALWRGIAFDELSLTRPTLLLRRTADGRTNLPTGRGDGADATPAARLPIGVLDARDLTVDVRDDLNRLALTLPPTSLRLSGEGGRIRGPIAMDGAAAVSWGGTAMELSRLDGELGFDGATLDVHRLTLTAPEGELTLRGRVDEVLGRLDVAIDYEMGVNLAQVAAGLTDTVAAGVLTLAGDLRGAASNLGASAEVSGSAVEWNGVALDQVTAALAMTPTNVTLSTARVAVAGGEVVAEGGVALNEALSGRLRAAWDAIDLDRVLAVIGVESPVSVGTSAGELEASWTAVDPRAVTLSAHHQSDPDADGPGLRLKAADGRWRVALDAPVAPSARVVGEVEAIISDDWSSASLGGGVAVTCGDVARCIQVVDAWRSRLPFPVTGAVAANAELGGTLSRPRIAGRITSPSLTVQRVSATDLWARFDADTTGMRLPDITVTVNGNEMGGQLDVRWSDGAMDGTATLLVDDLATLVPAAWAPAGQGRVDVAFGGELAGMRADGTLAFTDLALVGQRLGALTGRLRLDGATLTLEDVVAMRADGRAELRGEYDLTGGAAAVRLVARDYEITPLFPGSADEIPIAARVTLEVEARGALDDFTGTGRAEMSELSWSGYQLGRVAGDIDLASGRLHADMQLSDLGAAVSATLDLAGDRAYEIEAELRNSDLARLFPAVTGVAGRMSAAATAAGTLTDSSALQAEVRIAHLGGTLGAAALGVRRPAVVRYESGALHTDDVEIMVGDLTLRANGSLTNSSESTLALTLSGDIADVTDAVMKVTGVNAELAGLAASGILTVELMASGPRDRSTLSGTVRLDDGVLALRNHPPFIDLTVTGAIQDGVMAFDTVRGSWTGATLDAEAELPFEVVSEYLPKLLVSRFADRERLARAHVELTSLTPTALAAYISPSIVERLTGRTSAVLDLELPTLAPETLRGRLTLPEASFVVSGVPIEQRRPTEITAADGRVTIASFDWGNTTDYLTVGGGFTFGDTPRVDLSVTGTLDLRAASLLLPDSGTTGAVRLIADVTGPLAAPALRGTIEIDDGELRVADPRLVVTDLRGAIFLTADGLTVHELAGEANGGQLEMSGSWSLSGDGPRTIALHGEGIALEIPRGLRSETDLALRVTDGAGGLAVAGTATLLRGEYREPLSLAGGLLAALQQPSDLSPPTFDDDRDGTVSLDVRVLTVDDIVIENNYVEAELSADVRLGGTTGAPAVTGRVAIREGGRVLLGTRLYEIDTGAVDLVDPTGIEPQLTLTARTRVASHDITLAVAGGRDDLTTSLRSDPVRPEADIVSLLVTGRTLDQVSAAPSVGARDQALGLMSSEFLGQVVGRVGLDVRVASDAAATGGNIRFDPSLIASDVNPGTRLTVSRDLNERVSLTFSRSLRESDLAWLVDYFPRTDVEIRAFFNDENERAYEFRHALTAGAPPGRATTSGAAVAALRVRDVRFVGVVGFTDDEVRRPVSLRVGDRFDFHQWQRDQDRLVAFYRERGYWEARVRAGRQRHPEAGTVALTYEIEQGPRTTLVVTGHELPAEVRRDLQKVWARAVFDTFRLEELTRRVSSYLVDAGYLRADVNAEIKIDDPPEHKRIVLRIDAGDRADARRVVFDGIAADDERALRTFVDAQGLDRTAWTSPARFADAVTGWYREAGRLRASVVVSDPLVTGALAALPVRIEPGPLFRFGVIQVSGVAARPVGDVRALAQIEADEPYTARAVASARARIERSYRRSGYTTARVTARTEVDRTSATAAVAFEIREGPRQVIEEVVVDGAARTHPRLVSKALRLTPGEPVDMTAWNQARKRLYDTGVFRSVTLEARPRGPAASDGTVPVAARVVLEEQPTYRFRYGLRVVDDAAALDESTGRALRLGGTADLSRRNLFGRGLTTGVSSRVDRERRAVRAFLTVPTLFDREVESNLFVSRRRDTRGAGRNAFVEDVTTFTAEQRLRAGTAVTLAYSANLDFNRTFEQVSINPDVPFDIRVKIVRFNGNAIVEKRDSLFDATSGLFHSSNVEYGVEPGGSFKFAKYLGQQFHHRRIGPVVLASAVRIGLATGLGSELLPTERFLAGGGNTVRGYAQDSLGPVGFFGLRGGNALLILNQEARFPILWRLRGVGFVDAGNVFASARDVSLRALRVSVGVGLRVESPIGLLRIDYGLPLDRAPDAPRGRFFFSLGQAF